MLQGWGLMLFGPNWIRIQSLKKHLNNKMEMSHRAEILMRFLRNLDKLSYHIHNETKLCHTLGYAVIEKGYLSLLFLPRCAIWRRHRNITLLMRKPPSFVAISLFIKHLSNIQMVLIHSLVITFFFPLWNIYWKIMWTTENCKTSTNECWDNCTN